MVIRPFKLVLAVVGAAQFGVALAVQAGDMDILSGCLEADHAYSECSGQLLAICLEEDFGNATDDRSLVGCYTREIIVLNLLFDQKMRVYRSGLEGQELPAFDAAIAAVPEAISEVCAQGLAEEAFLDCFRQAKGTYIDRFQQGI